MGEGEAFVRAESKRRGIDPDVPVTVAKMEGGIDAPGLVGRFETGWSFWQFQLHYGGPDYPQFGTVAGMGNGFTKVTGWSPGDPAAWRDAARYALDYAREYGWGAWYGAKKAGIVGMRGIDVNFPWPGTPADEWDYKKRGAPMPLPYNADAPIDQQPDSWSCSVQSTQFLLRSIGRNPGDAWMEEQLVPAIVSKDVGLLKGSGEDLATWITVEYGSEMGFDAQFSPVTFDDVAAGAGINPTIMGGRGWNHWVGVRRLQSPNVLEIANPALGFGGIGGTITRSQFDALGPFHAVWIDRLSTLNQPPTPAPPADSRLARARALAEQLLAVLSEAG